MDKYFRPFSIAQTVVIPCRTIAFYSVYLNLGPKETWRDGRGELDLLAHFI